MKKEEISKAFIKKEKERAEKLYKEVEKHINQKEVWDAIAENWDSLKQKPFPSMVEKVALSWQSGKILGVGCGNCRNLLPFAQQGFDCYGIDFSKAMLQKARRFCKKNNFKVVLKQSRAEKLPFPSHSLNYCLCVEVLHHIETHEARRKVLLEMCRVLKGGGKALITVWNKVHPKFLLKSKHHYLTEKAKGKTYFKYCYLYDYLEIKRLIEKCGFNVLYSSGPLGKDLVFIVKKP